MGNMNGFSTGERTPQVLLDRLLTNEDFVKSLTDETQKDFNELASLVSGLHGEWIVQKKVDSSDTWLYHHTERTEDSARRFCGAQDNFRVAYRYISSPVVR